MFPASLNGVNKDTCKDCDYQGIIPEIEKRRKLTEEKQEAVVYESMEGINAALDYMLEIVGRGGEYQVFVIGEVLREERVIDFFKKFQKRRLKKGVRGRRLANVGFRDVLERHYVFKNLPMRFTNQKLPIGVFIFKNHVMNVIFEEKPKPTAIIIKSKPAYKHYKEFFEDLWKNAKR